MSVDKLKVPRQDLRVLKKNMVYCSGIPSTVTQDQLTSEQYFGQYGEITKIIVNPYPNKNYCSVYITFSHEFQAATAILACNEYEMGRSTLWCLFGTMKYCRFFLKKIECKNIPNCPYLHVLDKKNQIQINTSPSEVYPEHQNLAKQVFLKYPQEIKQLKKKSQIDRQLPSPIQAIFQLEGRKQQIQKQEKIQTNQQEKIPTNQQEIVTKLPKSGKSLEAKSKGTQKCLESMVKSMILKQLQQSRGSKVVNKQFPQEKNIKKIMISGLRD